MKRQKVLRFMKVFLKVSKEQLRNRWVVLLLVSLVANQIIYRIEFPYHFAIAQAFAISGSIGATCYFLKQNAWKGLVGIAGGGFLNLLALATNGGYMPATGYEEFIEAGKEAAPYAISAVGARLLWICDWIGGHMSPGDVLVFIGFAIFLYYVFKEYIFKELGQRKKAT